MVPDRFALLQDLLKPLWLPLKGLICVIIWKNHALQHASSVGISKLGQWVVERNPGVLHLWLFATRLQVHPFCNECIWSHSFMGRRAVKHPNPNCTGMEIFEDRNCSLHLHEKLGHIPPSISIFARIDYFPSISDLEM